jgi:hypothetical protein
MTSGAFMTLLFVWCESLALLCYMTSCRILPPAPSGWLSINKINWATATTNEMVQKYTIGFLMLAPAWKMHWLRGARLLWLLLLFLWWMIPRWLNPTTKETKLAFSTLRGIFFQCHVMLLRCCCIIFWKCTSRHVAVRGGKLNTARSCLSSLPLIGY